MLYPNTLVMCIINLFIFSLHLIPVPPIVTYILIGIFVELLIAIYVSILLHYIHNIFKPSVKMYGLN